MRRLLLMFLLSMPAGCRAPVLEAGNDHRVALTNLDALASAFEYRYTNVVRTAKFANARMRIARYAMAPSKLVHDTALWTSMRSSTAGARRELLVEGMPVNNQYVFSARSDAPLPSTIGEQQHRIVLEQKAEHDFVWHTSVLHHIGAMPPARADDITRALLLSAERPAAALRTDYRSTFPRTTTALGRLMLLDTVITARQPDGTTLVSLQFRVDAERIQSSYPAFARFIRRYVESSRSRFRLTDAAGNEWLDMQIQEKRVLLRLRSHGGRLQPLDGDARSMPDTLLLTIDARTRFGLFTAGATSLSGQFVQINSPRERAWSLTFTREPEWHLPPVAGRLIRSPLRHLFENGGISFRIGFGAGPGGQTFAGRSLEVPVRESPIMRFLGNLGFTAMSDFAGAVEQEENRFLATVFRAMRSDLSEL